MRDGWAHGGQRLADLRSHKGKITRFAAAKRRDQCEELVKVVLWSKFEVSELDGYASHNIDERAGYVKDLLDLYKN